jgi:hypothetical protein
MFLISNVLHRIIIAIKYYYFILFTVGIIKTTLNTIYKSIRILLVIDARLGTKDRLAIIG